MTMPTALAATISRLVPMQAKNMRLHHASDADSQWLQAALERISHSFGSHISHQPDGALIVCPPRQAAPAW